MTIEQTYRQLTGVDIEVQKRIWDERAIGYYGEFLVFSELYKHIPGNCKILMNLEIPVSTGGKTEIDLLLIHETGLYVFEIKHYKGTIYGNDTDAVWTQYFRTTTNQVFKNPIQQNGYHVRALSNLVTGTPIRSVVVFTNDECDLRVENSNTQIDILTLDKIYSSFNAQLNNSRKILTLDAINGIFTQLLPYSKLQEPVILNGKAATFQEWLEPALDTFHKEVYATKCEQEKLKKAEKQLVTEKKAIRIGGIFATILAIGACVALFLFSKTALDASYRNAIAEKEAEYQALIDQNTAELEQFKQNFLHVDQIGNDYIDDLASYVEVTDVSISPLTDDAVELNATVHISTDIYGCNFAENAKFIVMTESGTVFEYDVYGEHFPNYLYDEIWIPYRSKLEFQTALLYGITDPESISYIKITGISLFRVDDKYTIIKDNLEIELYDKSKQSETPDEIPE